VAVEFNALLLLAVLPSLDDLVEVMLVDDAQMALCEAFYDPDPFDIPGGLKHLLTEACALPNPGHLDQVQRLEHPLQFFPLVKRGLLLLELLSLGTSLQLFGQSLALFESFGL
jgi:hypothetical protein